MILCHNGVERDYPYIRETGPIPYWGDCYYDGVLDAHNDRYFLTLTGDDVGYDIDADGKWTYVGFNVPRRTSAWEGLFWVYEMDDRLRELLDVLPTGSKDYVLEAREYAEKNLEPVGYTGEYDLEKV